MMAMASGLAWMKFASSQSPDHLLTQILQDDRSPSARDWYVATSIIQWLATNVGMTVLEAAGFKYQQWDQDAADAALFRGRQERQEHVPSAKAAQADEP